MGGRSLTVYEVCFTEKKLNNTQVHNSFLDELAEILPTGAQSIILSDAIFKPPWFKAIEAKGWYWVGRVRGNVQLSLDGNTFISSVRIMAQATTRPKKTGPMLYSKSTGFPCQGVLYHGKIKGKHKKKKRGGVSQDSVSICYSTKAKQPWLLVYHLPKAINAAKEIVQLYRYRMQIEEGFRDTKNQQYGLGLAQAKSKSAKRYDNLLLVAALALYLFWCIGKAAVDKKYHYQLQENTIRHRTVLSKIYIAMQIINDKRYPMENKELRIVLDQISQFTQKVDGCD